MFYKNIEFLKLLEKNGISRTYARNSFALFFFITFAPIGYYKLVLIPRKIESGKKIDEFFDNISKEELRKFWVMSRDEKERFLDKLTEKPNSSLFRRP